MTSIETRLPALPHPTAGPAPAFSHLLVGVCGLAVAYALTGTLGLELVGADGYTTLLWLPAGIAVGALVRGGPRLWPGVLLGAFLVRLPSCPVWVAAGIAAGDSLAAVAAALLLRLKGCDPVLTRERDLGAFLLYGALVPMVLAAANTAGWLALGGQIPTGRFPAAWLAGWLGSIAGVLLAAPLVMTAAAHDLPRNFRDRRLWNSAGWLAVTAAASWLAFTDASPLASTPGLLIYLPLLVVVWVGLHQSLRAASLHLLLVTGFAVAGTANGSGAFGRFDPPTRLLMLWAFLTTAAVLTLALTTVTARRRRDAATLAAVTSEYRGLVDDSPALICRYTPDGTLTFANDTLCQFLGRRPDEVLGGSVLEFLPDLPRVNAPSDLPTRSGPELQLSHVGPLRRADGTERWHRWTARGVTSPDGEVREFHAVGVDITDRRRADEQRRAVERKLLETQRLESLGVLAGGLAHDFNNLLAGVLGHAELAVRSLPPGDPLREHLEPVVGGVKQAAGLTRQLLAYSGKGKFVVHPIDLGDVIRQGEPLLRASIPRKADLRFHLADDLPPVPGDPMQLRQVVMNLVTNAGEALGDRPGTITVSATAATLDRADLPDSYLFDPLPAGRYVLLRVEDTGSGMDAATVAKVFDPFFTTKFAGRGLGMAAVLGVVRAHGGGIRVESDPGVGTRVTVYCPAADGGSETLSTHGTAIALPTLHDPTPARPGPDPTPARRGSAGRVLVIDDEESIRRVAGMMLRQLGYDVLTACDGQEGVELFTAHAGSIQLVLLDLTMPRMDGAEALAAIRLLDPSVPVILCSGFTEDAVPEGLTRAGATGFLQKPFTMADLDRIVRTAVGSPLPN